MSNVPDQDLAQGASHLLVDVLLGAAELDVHVAVDTDESALVLSLAPLQADDDLLVNAARGGDVSRDWYTWGNPAREVGRGGRRTGLGGRASG